jgi:aminopeptidase N
MLEHELGEARWWRGVRHYVAANQGRQVSTEDFRVAMEESTGESLEWFFDQWLYRIGHPVFEVRKTYDPARQELTLTVTQTQTPDSTEPYPQVRWFQGKVDIEIDDRIETVRLAAVPVNRFTFHSAAPPRLVTFDYESVWIKELDFPATLDELLYQLEHDRDVVARWRAIDRLGAMSGDSATSPTDRARVRSGLRQLALSDAYWRLRIKAMVQLRNLQAPPLDPETLAMLQAIITRDSALVRTSAITSLGASGDPRYAPIYLAALEDSSDRVINAAAIALGKSRSPKAFDALARLPRRPSWKSQSLISALNGLKALGDPRGADIALRALADLRSPRWWLAVSAWDYPITATETLVALGAGKRAYPMLRERFQRSLEDGDDYDIFSNLLLLTTLADPRGEEVYGLLRTRYRDDPNALSAVAQYESQFKEAVKPAEPRRVP